MRERFVDLLADHNLPFAVALALMAMIALLQAFGLGGFDLDADADVDADFDGGDANGAGGLLSVLGIGRVPLMVWLACFLLVFALAGYGVQALITSLLGAPLDKWAAAAVVAVLSLPVTSALVRPLARILPGDRTTAVSTDTLLGRRAVITIGKASAGSPARGRVIDRFGHPHHVMIEPHDAAAVIGEGEQVLLVRRDRETFYATLLNDPRLSPPA